MCGECKEKVRENLERRMDEERRSKRVHVCVSERKAGGMVR